MSFEKTAFPITFVEPLDLSTMNYPPYHPFAPQFVVTVKNGYLYRTAIDNFDWTDFIPSALQNAARNVQVKCLETVLELRAASDIRCAAGTQLTSIMHIKTSPAGTGKNVYADSFVQWSSAIFKDNIAPISTPEIKTKALTAKKYTVAGKELYGFVAEENLLVKEVTLNPETGEDDTGVNVVSILAIQHETIKKLLTRIETLEEKIK